MAPFDYHPQHVHDHDHTLLRRKNGLDFTKSCIITPHHTMRGFYGQCENMNIPNHTFTGLPDIAAIEPLDPTALYDATNCQKSIAAANKQDVDSGSSTQCQPSKQPLNTVLPTGIKTCFQPKSRKPSLTSIITNGLETLQTENYSTATQGSAETMHFSGLPTPASLTKSASSAESLHLLAKLLSPLRSRASTGESLNKQAIWENFETQTTPPYAPQSDVHPPWHAGYNILPSESSTLYRTSTQGTRMGFTAESSNGQPEFPIAPLRSWGKLKAHDCFDVYKPTNTRYPTISEFCDIRSPVVRVNSAAAHTKYTAIWRKLNINIAEELFHWGHIYDQLLEEVLLKLSHYARLTEYDTASTNQIWKLYGTSLKVFSNAMRERYVRRFGFPRWACDEESLVKLIGTFDTCCSRNMKSDIDEACWSGSEKQIQGSLEIAIRFHTGYALARRYMRQIKVDPSHIYATAGDDYQLHVGLWDPHQPYHALYTRTSFKLEPDLPWLHWDSALHSFVGKIPADHEIRQTRSGTTSNPSGHYQLEIRIIAITCDPLPMGVVRETIVRATVSIWVLLPEKITPSFNILQTQGTYTFCPNSTEDSIYDARAENTGSERLSQSNGLPTCREIHGAVKQCKDFMLDSSFDTDLSGSEACFVSAMQSNFIPHLGSHTRMLRSTRAMTAAASNNQRLVSTDLANSSLIDGDHYDDNQSTTNSHEDMQYPNVLDSSHHGIQLPKSGVSNFLPPPFESETVHHGQGDHIGNSNSSMMNEIPDDISNCAIGIGNGSDHRNNNDERRHRYLNDSFGWDVSLMGSWEVAGDRDDDDDNSEVWEFHDSFRMPEDAGPFAGHLNEDIQCGSSFCTTLQT